MKPVSSTFIKKTIVFSLWIFLIAFSLASCTGTFPELTHYKEPTSEIDIYIQATSTMRGFTVRENSTYINTLESISLHELNVTDCKMNFYRFDVPYMTDEDTPFYSISELEFKYARSANSDFFTLDWITNNLAENPVSRERFNALHSIYREDVGVIRNMYIAPVLQYLQDNFKENQLSVVVTDLLDFGLDSASRDIKNAFRSIGSNSDMSIAIMVIMSEYFGENQIPGTTQLIGRSDIESENAFERPFYVIVMGHGSDVYDYTDGLRCLLSNNENIEVLYILKKDSFGNNSNIETIAGWNLLIDKANFSSNTNIDNGIERLRGESPDLEPAEKKVADSIPFFKIKRSALNRDEATSSHLYYSFLEELEFLGPLLPLTSLNTEHILDVLSAGAYPEKRGKIGDYFILKNDDGNISESRDENGDISSISLPLDIRFNNEQTGYGKYRLILKYSITHDWLEKFNTTNTIGDWRGEKTLALSEYVQALRQSANVRYNAENEWLIIFQRIYFIFNR